MGLGIGNSAEAKLPPVGLGSNDRPQAGGRHRGLEPALSQETIVLDHDAVEAGLASLIQRERWPPQTEPAPYGWIEEAEPGEPPTPARHDHQRPQLGEFEPRLDPNPG